MNQQLDRHLKRQGLLPSTRDKYKEILEAADTDDLIGWIERKTHARTPIGTILPMRAAVKHYLVAVLGYPEEHVQELLPKAKGRDAKLRQALSPRQLALYHAAVEQVDVEPAHTILTLLPMTGLRISEICGLRVENVRTFEGRPYLNFRGKRDKERIVPLTRGGAQALDLYFEKEQPSGWLFTGYSGHPIGAHAVRKYTRKIAQDYPDLVGLSPHVLRHTFATMALRKGMDLKRLQNLMGHESIQTTSRYLHPSVRDLQDAVDQME